MALSVFPVSVASGVTLASSIDTGQNGWRNVYLQVPTMASGSLYVNASVDGSTFYRTVNEKGNTATVHGDFIINSSATQRIIPIPAGLRYYQIESTSGATDVVTAFKIICAD